jgi:hypothetical protein
VYVVGWGCIRHHRLEQLGKEVLNTLTLKVG